MLLLKIGKTQGLQRPYSDWDVEILILSQAELANLPHQKKKSVYSKLSFQRFSVFSELLHVEIYGHY